VTSGGVGVLEGRPHYPPESLAVVCRAVALPGGDTAQQDALDCAFVKVCECFWCQDTSVALSCNYLISVHKFQLYLSVWYPEFVNKTDRIPSSQLISFQFICESSKVFKNPFLLTSS
jgi:hypothetical protein